MTPLDLLETARASITPGERVPGEADRRRAISTAYYVVFHGLAADCANLLVGEDRSDLEQDAWRQVYRALQHGPARDRCRNERRMIAFPSEIRRFALAFVQLQDARHDADYDPLARHSSADASGSIDAASEAIGALQAAAQADRRAFCVNVLFRDRR